MAGVKKLAFLGGKKLALLVGCNYPKTPSIKLQGCYNDVQNMRKTLSTKRFGYDFIKVLTDDPHLKDEAKDPNEVIKPTGENIKRELNSMVKHARRDDLLFFYFSGHGTKVQPLGSNTNDAAIIASDFNLITGADLKAIVEPLPAGVTFTIMADSDHSEGLFEKSPPSPVILFSACKVGEYRYEVNAPSGATGKVGAFSNAVQRFPRDNAGPVDNVTVNEKAGPNIKKHAIKNQTPCLLCSDESETQNFLLQDVELGTGSS